MTLHATSESPPSLDPTTGAPGPGLPTEPSAPEAPVTHVEDTIKADVADNAANEAADELIDEAESDPVVPGEPREAHRDGSLPGG